MLKKIIEFLVLKVFRRNNNILNIMWNNRDEIIIGRDYSINYGKKINDKNNKIDHSSEPLFEFVNKDIIDKYDDFINLLDNYTKKLKINEVYSINELKEIDTFINNTLKTKNGKLLNNFLLEEGFVEKKEDITIFIKDIWFTLYDRKKSGVKDSCGFEHIFVGEINGKKIGGYHYWLTTYLDELKGVFNHYGYHKKNRFILTNQFELEDTRKPIGGFIIGIDPYTQFCMYTIISLDTKFRTLDGICTFKYYYFKYNNKKYINTCYPVI